MSTVTVKLRLRDKHATELNRQARAVNFVWNYCNEISQKAWRDSRKWFSKFDLQKMTSGSSKELGLHSHTIQRVCYGFVAARDVKKRAGLRWRGRKSLGWVPFNTGHVEFNGETFKFRGVIYEPMHLNRRLRPFIMLGAGSFNQDSAGHWFINVSIEVSDAHIAKHSNDAVGIDLGLVTLATLSDGQKIENGKFYRESEKVIAELQRRRKTKRMRSVARKIANRRKDALHKASTKIVNEFGLIFVGNVSSKKLARTRFAKSVLDAGWSSFKKMLAYKSLMNGARFQEVNEAYTSQTCSSCGSLPSARPKGIAGLSKRMFECCDCNSVIDRDVNAAINIRRIGLDTLLGGTLSSSSGKGAITDIARQTPRELRYAT